MHFLAILLTAAFLVTGCGSKETRTSEDKIAAARQRAAKNRERPAPTPQPTRRIPAAVIPSGSLKEVLTSQRGVIQRLGRRESGQFLVPQEQVDSIKRALSSHLQVDPANMTILTNAESGSGWFGDVVVVVKKDDGRTHFIHKNGKEFVENMKDRVFGGTYRDDQFGEMLLTAWYGDMNRGEPYRVFFGVRKIQVLSFIVDRENNGSIRAKLKLPNGKVLAVTREARVADTVRVNGKPLSPLFR